MNNKIYCSSGTVIGRINGFNVNMFVDAVPYIDADGFEFLIVSPLYERIWDIVSLLEKKNVNIPVLHAEKEMGVYFASEDEEERAKGFSDFLLNCKAAKELGAGKLVLHLWSGRISDTSIENNISCLPELYRVASEHGLKLFIENVPCVKYDPLSNFRKILSSYPDAEFIFDTRFGAFHGQTDEILSSGLIESGKIGHMHFSDFVGGERDFTKLRPIPHLGYGVVGFDRILPVIAEKYGDSITLEAPEIHEDHTCPDKLNEDIALIRKYTEKK